MPTERWTFFPGWQAFASLGREKESGRRRGSGGNEEKEEESAHFSLFGLTPISGISGGVIAPSSSSLSLSLCLSLNADFVFFFLPRAKRRPKHSRMRSQRSGDRMGMLRKLADKMCEKAAE